LRLLLVEDDTGLADGLAHALRQSGYVVDWAASGEAAEAALMQAQYDLMILDLGLPGRDGFDVLRTLRSKGSSMMVLILTARDDTESRVSGLDLGADDYLTKPFVLEELEARLRALTRRIHGGGADFIRCGQLSLDLTGQRILLEDAPLALTRKEFQVLAYLIERRGKVVSKESLFERLYDWNAQANREAVEVYISRVRKKIEASNVTLRVVRGLGYLLEEKKDGLEDPK